MRKEMGHTIKVSIDRLIQTPKSLLTYIHSFSYLMGDSSYGQDTKLLEKTRSFSELRVWDGEEQREQFYRSWF